MQVYANPGETSRLPVGLPAAPGADSRWPAVKCADQGGEDMGTTARNCNTGQPPQAYSPDRRAELHAHPGRLQRRPLEASVCHLEVQQTFVCYLELESFGWYLETFVGVRGATWRRSCATWRLSWPPEDVRVLPGTFVRYLEAFACYLEVPQTFRDCSSFPAVALHSGRSEFDVED